MPVDQAQVARRTRQLEAIRAAKRGKPAGSINHAGPVTPTIELARIGQIDPTIVYTKQRLFTVLGIGEVTWKRWKDRGLKPFRSGKSLAVRGADVIAAMMVK